MRLAYLDCFAGISGDMFLGALIGAGVPVEVLQEAVTALDVNASLKVETVDRSGISCTKVHVFEEAAQAEDAGGRVEQAHRELAYTQEPKTRHLHKTGYAHTHGGEAEVPHSHAHGRPLSAIRALIQKAALADPVKQTAIRAFELLGQAEAKIHNVPVEEIHFHEVGAVDAIVDIVAASAGIHYLSAGAWYCSPVNVGGGMVVCAHGTFPVPAPATADLLRGVPTYSAHVQKELATPTGAALLRALKPAFGPQPAMKVEQIGYGAGTRNTEGFPNVLRLSVGEAADTAGAAHTVTVIETALDDLSPQVLAHVTEAALAKGALDVMLTPVIMKKGRPGTLLTVLCDERDRHSLEHLILSETSTLGVRIRQDRRVCLDRGHTTVETKYGAIRIKTGSRLGEEFNAAPEFEDCKRAALAHNVPVKQVQQAAIAAYRR
ncbi:MAG: nickel pincer cofactor biosynthesis protein LarC [Acidobacteriaceae bacterium]|jgi:uncharacterized protein (TIGR00299 family) protein